MQARKRALRLCMSTYAHACPSLPAFCDVAVHLKRVCMCICVCAPAADLAAEGRKHSRDLPPHLIPHPLSRGPSGSYDESRGMVCA